LDPGSDDDKAACEGFECGDAQWSQDVRKWIVERLWAEEDEHNRGHTILFEDEDTGDLVGYATWRIRKIRLPPDHKQHRVIELHYLGIVSKYQGEKCATGESVASQIFATMEQQARGHKRAKHDMPIVLEVEVGNDHARDVYLYWEFEVIGPREAAGTGRRYEVLSRAATEGD
jgi:hypothetical protein